MFLKGIQLLKFLNTYRKMRNCLKFKINENTLVVPRFYFERGKIRRYGPRGS